MHIFFALMLSAFIPTDESVLETVSGETFTGTLESISRDSIQFKIGGTNESFEFNQVASILLGTTNPQSVELAPIELTLVDDSVIRASSFSCSSGKSQVETADKLSWEIENRDVHSVLFSAPSDVDAQIRWDRIQESPLKSGDAIVVSRGDRLEAIEGIVGDVNADKVEFRLGNRTASIDRTKIIGVIFYHARGRDIPPVKCQLDLCDGSLLRLRRLDVTDDSFLAETCSGVRLKLPRSAVSRLECSLGRTVVLSSMTPVNRDWTPLVAGSAILEKLKQIRLPRANRSFDNQPLELAFYPDDNDLAKVPQTQTFDNGFAMVGGSKLVFSLDRQFERLTGMAGFSPTADSEGNVTLKIRCDNRVALQQQLRKSDNKNPVKLDICVKDVQRLVIEVDYQDGRSIGDLIHLCNLKVSR